MFGLQHDTVRADGGCAVLAVVGLWNVVVLTLALLWRL